MNDSPRDKCPQTPRSSSSSLQATSLIGFIASYLGSLGEEPLSPPTSMMTTIILILPDLISKDRMWIDDSSIGLTTVRLRLLFD